MDRTDIPLGILIKPHSGKLEGATVLTHVAKILVDGVGILLGNPSSYLSGPKSLIELANSFQFSDEVSADSYNIILLALGWTLDSIRDKSASNPAELTSEIRSLISLTRGLLDNKEYYLEPEFFMSPSTNGLYREIVSELSPVLKILRPNVDHDSSDLRNRLDRTFDRAVLEISLQRQDVYKRLSETLAIADHSASRLEFDWRHYQSLIANDFHSSILFGQEATRVSLAEVYVPLRASPTNEAEPANSAEGTPNGDALDEDQSEIAYQASEMFYLVEQLANEFKDDRLSSVTLVGGGPGSGKSTSIKALCAEVSGYDYSKTIYVPLQHLNLDSDLKSEIERIVSERTGAFRIRGPLSDDSLRHCKRLLIAFDGLDEIARPGERADQIAQQFVVKLNQLMLSLTNREISPNVSFVVSGRLPAFQAARRFLDIDGNRCLQLAGFLADPDAASGTLAHLDQRPIWWARFSKTFKKPVTPPDTFMAEQWESLTEEPLLCYLLALSGYIDGASEGQFYNINQIYRALIDQIWLRGWGDQGSLQTRGVARSLSKHDFSELMETIALAAWQGGDTRTASEQSFLQVLEDLRRDDAWKRFERDNGADTANLAMNFYLKSPENSSRGFEFTHKSFGDYLAARCIVYSAMDLLEYGQRRLDVALRDWHQFTRRCVFSEEITNFVFQEIDLLCAESTTGSDKVAALKSYFEEMELVIAQDGFEASGSSRTRIVHSEHVNSEAATLAIIAACFQARLSRSGVCSRFAIPENKDFDFSDILLRICTNEGFFTSSSNGRFFCGIDARGTDFFRIAVSEVDFTGSSLENCNFSWGVLRFCNFRDCELEHSRFLRTTIYSCDFRGANINFTYFALARIDATNLFEETRGIVLVNGITLLAMSDHLFEQISTDEAIKRRVNRTDAYMSRDESDLRPRLDFYESGSLSFMSEAEIGESEIPSRQPNAGHFTVFPKIPGTEH